MDVRDICSGLDPASAHRVSMEGPIFKPVGNPIALFMKLFCPKPNYFIQSWVGTFPDIQQSKMDIFGVQAPVLEGTTGVCKKKTLSILMDPKNVNVGLLDFRKCPDPRLGEIFGFGRKQFHKKNSGIAKWLENGSIHTNSVSRSWIQA